MCIWAPDHIIELFLHWNSYCYRYRFDCKSILFQSKILCTIYHLLISFPLYHPTVLITIFSFFIVSHDFYHHNNNINDKITTTISSNENYNNNSYNDTDKCYYLYCYCIKLILILIVIMKILMIIVIMMLIIIVLAKTIVTIMTTKNYPHYCYHYCQWC